MNDGEIVLSFDPADPGGKIEYFRTHGNGVLEHLDRRDAVAYMIIANEMDSMIVSKQGGKSTFAALVAHAHKEGIVLPEVLFPQIQVPAIEAFGRLNDSLRQTMAALAAFRPPPPVYVRPAPRIECSGRARLLCRYLGMHSRAEHAWMRARRTAKLRERRRAIRRNRALAREHD